MKASYIELYNLKRSKRSSIPKKNKKIKKIILMIDNYFRFNKLGLFYKCRIIKDYK
jgi:hypothetical protein